MSFHRLVGDLLKSISKGTPDYPTLPQVQSYIESYCDHFSLVPHIRCGHNVKHISRTSDDAKWRIEFVDKIGVEHEEVFDKIIMAVGQTGQRLMPVGIESLENFKGRVLHGQSFKRCVVLN
jgi:dimethylaniline monooxygenase (N-oxide forming)